MKRVWLWLPLGLFVAFFGVVALGLYRPDDRTHPSKLIGKPMPEFALPPAAIGAPRPRQHRPSGAAAPRQRLCQLVRALRERGTRPRHAGAARRHRRRDRHPRPARRTSPVFLARYGNPFRAIGDDPASQVQISLGSSGVPETFVVDATGIIRYQHIGPIEPGDVNTILAKLGAAR